MRRLILLSIVLMICTSCASMQITDNIPAGSPKGYVEFYYLGTVWSSEAADKYSVAMNQASKEPSQRRLSGTGMAGGFFGELERQGTIMNGYTYPYVFSTEGQKENELISEGQVNGITDFHFKKYRRIAKMPGFHSFCIKTGKVFHNPLFSFDTTLQGRYKIAESGKDLAIFIEQSDLLNAEVKENMLSLIRIELIEDRRTDDQIFFKYRGTSKGMIPVNIDNSNTDVFVKCIESEDKEVRYIALDTLINNSSELKNMNDEIISRVKIIREKDDCEAVRKLAGELLEKYKL